MIMSIDIFTTGSGVILHKWSGYDNLNFGNTGKDLKFPIFGIIEKIETIDNISIFNLNNSSTFLRSATIIFPDDQIYGIVLREDVGSSISYQSKCGFLRADYFKYNTKYVDKLKWAINPDDVKVIPGSMHIFDHEYICVHNFKTHNHKIFKKDVGCYTSLDGLLHFLR